MCTSVKEQHYAPCKCAVAVRCHSNRTQPIYLRTWSRLRLTVNWIYRCVHILKSSQKRERGRWRCEALSTFRSCAVISVPSSSSSLRKIKRNRRFVDMKQNFAESRLDVSEKHVRLGDFQLILSSYNVFKYVRVCFLYNGFCASLYKVVDFLVLKRMFT